MPDSEHLTTGARFAPSVPVRQEVFPLKGCGALDWGMQSRLARIFRPDTGRTVMLAIDHGYFQGPTTGLERVDLSILPLLPYADALMTTRGMVRSTVPPASRVPVVLRASGGPSVLRDLSDERLAVSMEDAARINAAAVAVQVFIGGEHETQSVRNMTRLVDAGQRYGIPVLAVTAVGTELTRDARYLRLATRICDRKRRGRRGHGPQYLPERHPAGDDPRDRGGRPRIRQARGRLPALPVPARSGWVRRRLRRGRGAADEPG
jgi:putative autoinducer-2 (AI-2) aldolase